LPGCIQRRPSSDTQGGRLATLGTLPHVRVFISWSGEPSRSIAHALNGWLEGVLPQVEPWMSDDGIDSGARWNEVIAESLDETNYGVVCITRSNQHAPWLTFEAGALAKSARTAKVVPLCIDLPFSDVTGLLQLFKSGGSIRMTSSGCFMT